MRPGPITSLLGIVGVVGCARALPTTVGYGGAPALSALAMAAAGTAAEPDTGSLTLAQAFRLALARSERVSLAEQGIREAEIRHREAWTEVTPAINVTGSAVAQSELSSGGTVFVPGTYVTGGADFSQPVFRRDLFAARRAGDYGRRSAEANYQRAREQLARDVVEAYIAVLRARKLVALATDAVDRAQTQHQLATARVKAGQALKNAELLAIVDLTRAQRLQVTAERDAATAAVGFERLVGRQPPAAMDMPAIPTAPDLPRALELAAKRSDLQALELALQRAQAQLDVASGRRLWPKLDVDANLVYTNPKSYDQAIQWQVIGLVTLPLLQSGHELIDISLRENDAHVATLEIDLQRKLIVEEVQAAAQRMASAARAAELASQQRDAARDNYKLVDKQARLGAITPLEVTTAQAVVTEAETAYEVASMDRAASVYEYLFAVGALDLAGKR